ncbi:hypothetical protein [Pleurocapsa sp. FMAR1]|uniref:hypothetical protein n=1 Tax=Pleurocapsa sp. FMAR1 TaxID=3040204 RepID=UPI0029C8F6B9|nr:hypothetical protein [Pleurocapsa sp. FMAR1]
MNSSWCLYVALTLYQHRTVSGVNLDRYTKLIIEQYVRQLIQLVITNLLFKIWLLSTLGWQPFANY